MPGTAGPRDTDVAAWEQQQLWAAQASRDGPEHCSASSREERRPDPTWLGL